MEPFNINNHAFQGMHIISTKNNEKILLIICVKRITLPLFNKALIIFHVEYAASKETFMEFSKLLGQINHILFEEEAKILNSYRIY